jgi:dTDP-4-dehydrorhamnose 3,5-epimerase
MKIRPLRIEGAYEVTPVQHGDPRGVFLEWYRHDHLAAELGHGLNLAQANISLSARGVVRGIHFAQVPPGQGKYLTCPAGALLDVVVDLRVGSPTFGQWDTVVLDDVDRRAVYVAEGLGHGFCALSESATLAYLCAETYNPAREFSVHPLDPELGIEWPAEAPQLSARDAAAPSLADTAAAGLLPTLAACRAYEEQLRDEYARQHANAG